MERKPSHKTKRMRYRMDNLSPSRRHSFNGMLESLFGLVGSTGGTGFSSLDESGEESIGDFSTDALKGAVPGAARIFVAAGASFSVSLDVLWNAF